MEVVMGKRGIKFDDLASPEASQHISACQQMWPLPN